MTASDLARISSLGAATGEINAHLDQHLSRTSAHHQTLPTWCATRVEVTAKPTMIMTPLWFSAFPQLHDSVHLETPAFLQVEGLAVLPAVQ